MNIALAQRFKAGLNPHKFAGNKVDHSFGLQIDFDTENVSESHRVKAYL